MPFCSAWTMSHSTRRGWSQTTVHAGDTNEVCADACQRYEPPVPTVELTQLWRNLVRSHKTDVKIPAQISPKWAQMSSCRKSMPCSGITYTSRGQETMWTLVFSVNKCLTDLKPSMLQLRFHVLVAFLLVFLSFTLRMFAQNSDQCRCFESGMRRSLPLKPRALTN